MWALCSFRSVPGYRRGGGPRSVQPGRCWAPPGVRTPASSGARPPDPRDRPTHQSAATSAVFLPVAASAFSLWGHGVPGAFRTPPSILWDRTRDGGRGQPWHTADPRGPHEGLGRYASWLDAAPRPLFSVASLWPQKPDLLLLPADVRQTLPPSALGTESRACAPRSPTPAVLSPLAAPGPGP